MKYKFYEVVELAQKKDVKAHTNGSDLYMMIYEGRPCWFYKRNDQFFKSVSFSDEAIYRDCFEIYTPSPIITRTQHSILSAIHKAYHYIGRDSDGALGVFSSEPYRMNGNWTIYTFISGGLATRLPLKKDALDFIKSDDNKAYKIEDLLRGYNSEV